MRYGEHNTSVETQSDGTLLYQAVTPLGTVADTTSVWLHKWAVERPSATFLAERSGDGWRTVSYAEALEMVRAIGGSLIERGLTAETPILVISGNSVDHALLALAAQYVGVPTVPIAEQYSLIPQARGRLIEAAELVNPAMVFAQDTDRYGAALELFPEKDRVVVQGTGYTTIADLAKGSTTDVDAAHGLVGPDSVVKILLTSGSTSAPKAVPTTHKMMCTNQAQLALALPFLQDRPPVVVDWLPWNHVFGGSHNFNAILANGGSFYIDEGKPTPALIGRTVENLKLQSGSLAFNVPVGFALLLKEFDRDPELAKSYFSDLDMMFYAGASLPQDVWEGFEKYALKYRGALPLMTSSWGLTETAPACLMQQEPIRKSGIVGVPLSGTTMKMIPNGDDRYEIRVKGPNIMTGYLNNPEKTAEAFDEDGYFITGDAMAFVDAQDPNKGLRFDGRISEEFKLLTGTWVRAGALRMDVLAGLVPLATDVVITGADLSEIGAMIFPDPGQLSALGFNGKSQDGIVTDANILAVFGEKLTEMQKFSASSSTRIARAVVLTEPASMPDGEMTAKGNLNFRKILTRRADILDHLYQGGQGVITLGK
jgi:feruloyl-CoA synthase